MIAEARSELLRCATRYIWWERPDTAVRRPLRVIAQVMNIGDFEDVQRMIATVGVKELRQAMRQAEPGWFNERSWSYWCYRLGVVAVGEAPPPIPQRTFEESQPVSKEPVRYI